MKKVAFLVVVLLSCISCQIMEKPFPAWEGAPDVMAKQLQEEDFITLVTKELAFSAIIEMIKGVTNRNIIYDKEKLFIFITPHIVKATEDTDKQLRVDLDVDSREEKKTYPVIWGGENQ